MQPLYLVLCMLAAWRVTHLISMEDGPFDIIYQTRKKLGHGFLGKLMDCFYCCSVWTALPFGIWLGSNWQEKILCWLAVSGAACLLERATAGKDNAVKTPQLPDYTED